MIISVEGAPGFDAVDHFDAADLHQPVAAAEAEPRRFSIEDDFTHSDTIAPKPPRGKRSGHETARASPPSGNRSRSRPRRAHASPRRASGAQGSPRIAPPLCSAARADRKRVGWG